MGDNLECSISSIAASDLSSHVDYAGIRDCVVGFKSSGVNFFGATLALSASQICSRVRRKFGRWPRAMD